MKWNFMMVIFIQLVCVLWCGVVTNAQDEEPSRRNATTTIVSRPSTVVGNMNSSRTTPLSHLAEKQTTVSHHSTIRGTRTIVNSTMTVIPTTVHPTTATRTIGSSSMSVISPTVLPATSGPMRGDDSKLGLVIGCIAAAVVVAIVVSLMALLYKRRKQRKRSASEREKNASRPYHDRPLEAAINPGADELGDNVYDVRHEHWEEDESVHVVSPSRHLSLKSALPPRTSSRWPDLAESPSGPSLSGTARRVDQPSSAGFYNSIAEEEDSVPMSELKERRSRTVSKRPGLVKKIITTEGGDMKIDDITLKIGAACLAKDTEITLIKDDQNFAFKSLHDLGLVDAAPRVVEFLPDGLKFLKPADLTIRFENVVSNSELFILHGSYNRDYQRTVWELVTNDIEDNKAEGFVNMKINGFCFYSYIFARRGKIARILSHLNNSFTCRAYALYRRLPSMDTIDISVVFVSKFVDDDKEEDIKQLKDHLEAGYVKGEKGMLKRVHTDRRLEMCLDFPGAPSTPISFKVDKAELDDDGFVVDHFKEIAVKSPASGKVKISEVHRSAENKLLWQLNVREMEQQITVEKAQVQFAGEDAEPQVIYRTTKLTHREISRMSRMVGVDWDSLAGLMDIPYSEREEIRLNHAKYPDFSSKAEQIFALFNGSKYFGRHILEKCVEELNLHNLKGEMLPVENENGEEEEPLSPPVHPYENVVLRNTPLSSREMFRLSRRIVVDWDSLAGLMDIAKEERNNIRNNTMYNDDRARAEKILSMFNHRKDFSREKLVECVKGIHKLDLISPIKTGQLRSL